MSCGILTDYLDIRTNAMGTKPDIYGELDAEGCSDHSEYQPLTRIHRRYSETRYPVVSCVKPGLDMVVEHLP